MQKAFYILVLSTCFCFQLSAQGQFALHLDKAFYTTGEEIWYKLYLPPGLNNQIAVKGIIISPSGTIVERFFHKTKEGKRYVDGYFKIPFNYKSGNHRIEFRASGAPAEPEIVLVSFEFPIYNDFDLKQLAEQKDQTPNGVKASAPVYSDLDIAINLNKGEFSRREQLSAQIKITDKNGNPVEAQYSISAVDASLVNDALPNAQVYKKGQSLNLAQLNQLKGDIFVKGQVFDTLNQPIQANVLGAYASLQKRIHYGKTDTKGVFTYYVPDFYGSQTLQFIGYPKEEEEIRIKLLSETDNAEKISGELPINDKILQYLETSQQKKKMAEYFENLVTQIDLEKMDTEFKGLKADFSYNSEEYVKFESIGDFFSELITPLKFRIVKGVYEARMENPRSRDASFINLPGKPIFIIDGKVTRNADFIARTSWSNVLTVDIFYVSEKLKKEFNILGQGGVVRITTSIPEFNLPPNDLEDVFTVDGLKQSGSFIPYKPGTSSGENRIPSFNMPAYWAVDQATDKNGSATSSFYQGDEESTYIITVVAQTADGKMGIASKRYTVK